MKRKYFAAACAMLLAVSMTTGCAVTESSKTDTTEETAEEEEQEETASGEETEEAAEETTEETAEEETAEEETTQEDGEEAEAVYGQVVSISDEEIVITVGTLREGMDGGEPGEMGEAPDGDGEAPDGDGEAPEMGEAPDGDGEAPEMDEAPEGDGEMPEMGEAPDGDGEMPEMPDGSDGAPDGDGEAPEMGEAPEGDGEAPDMDGEAPDMDEAPDGTPGGGMGGGRGGDPGMGGGMDGGTPSMLELGEEEQTIAITSDTVMEEEIEEGDEVQITLDEDGNAAEISLLGMDGGDFGEGGMGDAPGMDGGMGGEMPGGGTSSGVDSYDAVTEYTEDTEVEDASYTSTGTDKNAILVSGGAYVSLKDITVTRESDDSTGGDDSSFYGVGAAILVTDGTAVIEDAKIDTDADGGAGIFAYADGVVYVKDTEITTKQDTSGGIHAAGGGTVYAWDLEVETNGTSSAAIRSDRGGGTMVVDGGTYTSNGSDSPAVYVTADIVINDAELTSNGAEAICIEGLNSLRLFDCDLSGNLSDDDRNDCTWNVILYQSMSGDSEVGNSSFEMAGGTLTAKNGGMFYTTNTESTFVLSDVEITYAKDSEFFLKCTGNDNSRGWGSVGSNGAQCTFTAYDQEMEGDVIWDSVSTLDFYLLDESTLTGAVLNDESAAGDGGDGYCSLYLEKGSTWVVTADSVLTNLYAAGEVVDEDGDTVSIVGEDGTVYVDGDSEYTVTVANYEDSADLSGATELTSFADYEVEWPEDGAVASFDAADDADDDAEDDTDDDVDEDVEENEDEDAGEDEEEDDTEDDDAGDTTKAKSL